jgi:hypothetical protein
VDLIEGSSDGLELSLKLYHARKLPPDYQHLTTETLPVMKEVKLAAAYRKIELLIFPTAQAIKVLEQDRDETNAVLHVTC